MPTCKAQPQKVGSRADHRPVAQNLHFSSSFSSVPLCLRMIRKLPQSEGRPAGLLAKSAAERKVQKCKAGGAMAHYCTALHCCAENEALKVAEYCCKTSSNYTFATFFSATRPSTFNKRKGPISSNASSREQNTTLCFIFSFFTNIFLIRYAYKLREDWIKKFG